MNRFLQWCAGANPKILAQEECLTDRMRYEGLGKLVLATGILASLSGGYALFAVFGSAQIAAVLGVSWGSLIITIDRSMVMNIKKKCNGSIGRQLLMAAPRLGLATVLAVVVAKPLELQIFQGEIHEKIVEKHQEELEKRQEALNKSSSITGLKNQRDTLQQKLSNLERERTQQFNASMDEAEGKAGTRLLGKGLVYAEKSDEVKRYEPRISKTQQELATLDGKITNVQQEQEKAMQELATAKAEADSLLLRITTLEKLGKDDPLIGTINIFVTLLFVLLETSPVITKLLSSYGPYDAIVESRESSVIERTQFHTQELIKAQREDYERVRAVHIQKQEFELEQQLAEYRALRTKLQEFIHQQFTELVNAALVAPEYNDVQQRVLEKIVKTVEDELVKYAEGVTASAVELANLLDEVKEQVRSEMLSTRLKREVTDKRMVGAMKNFEQETEQIMNQLNNVNHN